MTKARKDKLLAYIKAHTLRLEASRRGGGIEIDLAEYLSLPGAKMTAYQNYLGGGLLGSIEHSYNFDRDTLNKTRDEKLDAIAGVLRQYFHSITNAEAGEYDEWSAADFAAVQARPASGY